MKIYLLFLSFILFNLSLHSQANLLNARVPQDIGQLNEKQVESNDEEPLEYGFMMIGMFCGLKQFGKQLILMRE